MGSTHRKQCPECGSEDTEFIEFCTGNESNIETDKDEIGNGLLELRHCTECQSSIENILTLESQTVRTPPNN